MKSEIRNSRAERRPKAEIRTTKRSISSHGHFRQKNPRAETFLCPESFCLRGFKFDCVRAEVNCIYSLSGSIYSGKRSSVFVRPSDFGLRN
jgi:hypothetical protein